MLLMGKGLRFGCPDLLASEAFVSIGQIHFDRSARVHHVVVGALIMFKYVNHVYLLQAF